MLTKAALFVLLIGLAHAISSEEDVDLTIGPALIKMPEPTMPLSLQTTRMREPKATVEVIISEDGRVYDAICIAADHYQMAAKAESIAMQCMFRPATENGIPIPSRSEMEIDFIYRSNRTTMKTTVDDLIDFIGWTPKRIEHSLIFCQPKELDESLRIEWMPPMVIVKDEFGNPHYGKALIEGYVDMDGKLRLLNVIRADTPYVGEAAIKTFEDLVFNKPRSQGIRAITLIRIPFEIKAPRQE